MAAIAKGELQSRKDNISTTFRQLMTDRIAVVLEPVDDAPAGHLRNKTTQDWPEHKGERQCDADGFANRLGLVSRPDLGKADGCQAIEASSSDALKGTAYNTKQHMSESAST